MKKDIPLSPPSKGGTEMKWTSDGKTRKMRKADQYRFNSETGYLEVYQIDVPLELEDWEQAGLEKQSEMRKKRKSKSGNGENDESGNSELSD